MINPKTKKGFTLIELLIGITIFVVFMGVVAQSYISIVRSFRQQNEIRKVYGEVRDFMDFLAEEARLSAVDYSCYDTGVSSCIEPDLSLNQGFTDTIVLRNKNGLEQTVISFDENVTVQKWEKQSGTWILQDGYTEAIQ
ncbi:prepilin-type N-terminal cleavage/methylation domain-containing protein, partial [Candidatus Peregrinibacteria bacterium]|nr:prepilin-type N-terminal cleavage/methylation domain-containing protein [Candidatus Peregrinibacteria bacterium]